MENKKVNLIMMVGIPASGKSTLSKKLKKEQGYTIHSSDTLRNLKIQEKDIFNTLHQNIIKDLNNGIDCIYDATNLKSHIRRQKINYIRNLCENDINIICIYFEPNVNLSIERNNKRTLTKRVPLEIVEDMNRNFNIPRMNEGFNKIVKVEVTNGLN